MKQISTFCVLLVLLFASKSYGQTCVVELNTDYPGADLGCPSHITTREGCCDECSTTSGCVSWTFVNNNGTHRCCLKNAFQPNRIQSDCCDSGYELSDVGNEEFILTTSYDCPGYDIASISVAFDDPDDKRRCADDCVSRTNCVGFNFPRDASETVCYLKFGENNCGPHSKFDYFHRDSPLTTETPPNGFTFTTSYDCPGSDIEALAVAFDNPDDRQRCADACASKFECLGFNFPAVASESLCYLKFAQVDCGTHPNFNYFHKDIEVTLPPLNPSDECDYEDGVVFVGSPLSTEEVETLEDCCESCKNTEVCRAWTYDSEEGTCLLFDQELEEDDCDFCVSGRVWKDKHTSKDPLSCLLLPDSIFTDTPFVCLVEVHSLEECCDLCTTDSRCAAWTHYRYEDLCCLQEFSTLVEQHQPDECCDSGFSGVLSEIGH